MNVTVAPAPGRPLIVPVLPEIRLPEASWTGATAPEIVPPGPNVGTEFVPNSW